MSNVCGWTWLWLKQDRSDAEAKPSEYVALKKELEGLGYRLIVRERCSPIDRYTRHRVARDQFASEKLPSTPE